METTTRNVNALASGFWLSVLVCAPLAAFGDIATVAGGIAGYGGDNGPATSAQMLQPNGSAFDGAGRLVIADTLNHRIRMVDASGIITTVAGRGVATPGDSGGYGGDSGPALDAGLNAPGGIAFDSMGNLYIADTQNHRIRMVDASGIITTVAGSGVAGFAGDNGPATDAKLSSPITLAFDSAGNFYIADGQNQRVRRVAVNGVITTHAGNGMSAPAGAPIGDNGPAADALLRGPQGLAVDAADNLYIADTSNHRIRMVDANGIITTAAGNGSQGFAGDNGPATEAKLAFPRGIAFDGAGNLYIADTGNHRIRMLDSNGLIATVAGAGAIGYSGDNDLAVLAKLHGPQGVTANAAGDLFIADTKNSAIRMVDSGVPSLDVDSFFEAGPMPEPADIDSVLGASAPAMVMDIAFNDTGARDGLPTLITSLTFDLGFTTADASEHLWFLDGPDAANIAGTVSGPVGTQLLVFPGLSIMIDDGASETYALGLQLAATPAGTADGDTVTCTLYPSGIVCGVNSSLMDSKQGGIANGYSLTYSVAASALAIVTQPLPVQTTGAGFDLIAAFVDANGNVDRDVDSDIVSVARSDGGAVLGGNATALAGIASFTGLSQVVLGAPDNISGALRLVLTDDAAGSRNFSASPATSNVLMLNGTGSGSGAIVTGISPSSGPIAGGTPVMIAGTGFTGATGVAFGAAIVDAAGFISLSDSLIEVPSAAAAAPGNAEVHVMTAAGVSTTFATYTYVGGTVLPALTSVSPSSGPVEGATPVTLTGTGFTGATAVAFGSVVLGAANFTIVNDTRITVMSPAAAIAGAVAVSVTTPAGAAALPDAFLYETQGGGAASGSRALASGGGACSLTKGGADWSLRFAPSLILAALLLGALRRRKRESHALRHMVLGLSLVLGAALCLSACNSGGSRPFEKPEQPAGPRAPKISRVVKIVLR